MVISLMWLGPVVMVVVKRRSHEGRQRRGGKKGDLREKEKEGVKSERD